MLVKQISPQPTVYRQAGRTEKKESPDKARRKEEGDVPGGMSGDSEKEGREWFP